MQTTNNINYQNLIKTVSNFNGYTELTELHDTLNTMFDSAIRNKETDYKKEYLAEMNFNIKCIMNLAIELKELNDFIISEDNKVLHMSEITNKIA